MKKLIGAEKGKLGTDEMIVLAKKENCDVERADVPNTTCKMKYKQ
jgi:hypothetical protein